MPGTGQVLFTGKASLYGTFNTRHIKVLYKNEKQSVAGTHWLVVNGILKENKISQCGVRYE